MKKKDRKGASHNETQLLAVTPNPGESSGTTENFIETLDYLTRENLRKANQNAKP